jgi:outer membrane immunogenic protein
MTSRVLFGGLALAAGVVGSVCGAQAADLPPAPPMAPAAPIAYAPQIYNWSGVYVGGHLGGAYSASSWTDPFNPGTNDDSNSWGFLGGGQVGANAQFNRLVIGVEGDFSWINSKNNGTDSMGEALSTNVQWTSTVAGRVGAAFDRLLVYGKGGLALAQDQSSLTDLGGNVATDSFLRTGWTVGAGLEYALDDHWSAKIEYDYLGFGSQNMNFTTPLESVSSSANLNLQEVKAGINFRFGGGQ